MNIFHLVGVLNPQRGHLSSSGYFFIYLVFFFFFFSVVGGDDRCLRTGLYGQVVCMS